MGFGCLSSAHLWQGAREHLACRPSSVRFSCCHRRRPLPVALCHQLAPSLARLYEPHPQRGMGAYKMIVGAPPLQMSQELWSLLGSGPGPSRERCHPVSDGQIHPLDERRVQPSRETQSLQGDGEICQCPQAHYRRDAHQLAPPVAFLHLTVDQLRCHLPLECFPSSATHLSPLSKMGREGIKVQV